MAAVTGEQLELPFGNLKPKSGTKAPLSMLPASAMVHASRAVQFGADKYARGNWLADNGHDRIMGYLDATLRHVLAVASMYEYHAGIGAPSPGPALAYPDPESHLPHLAHALAALSMAVTLAVDAGHLPADPGTPWKENP